MEFEKSVQRALKTLRASLAQHEAHRKGYERTIDRLIELQKNVPPQAKVKRQLSSAHDSSLWAKLSVFSVGHYESMTTTVFSI